MFSAELTATHCETGLEVGEVAGEMTTQWPGVGSADTAVTGFVAGAGLPPGLGEALGVEPLGLEVVLEPCWPEAAACALT